MTDPDDLHMCDCNLCPYCGSEQQVALNADDARSKVIEAARAMEAHRKLGPNDHHAPGWQTDMLILVEDFQRAVAALEGGGA